MLFIIKAGSFVVTEERKELCNLFFHSVICLEHLFMSVPRDLCGSFSSSAEWLFSYFVTSLAMGEWGSLHFLLVQTMSQSMFYLPASCGSSHPSDESAAGKQSWLTLPDDTPLYPSQPGHATTRLLPGSDWAWQGYLTCLLCDSRATLAEGHPTIWLKFPQNCAAVWGTSYLVLPSFSPFSDVRSASSSEGSACFLLSPSAFVLCKCVPQ